MKNFFTQDLTKKQELIGLVVLVVISAIGYGVYRYDLLAKKFTTATQMYEEKIGVLENNLAQAKNENEELVRARDAQQAQVDQFGAQISDIKNTVSAIEKLKKLDPELLQKYSKVYFLNENYWPGKLTDIDPKYLFSTGTPAQLHTLALPYLKRLIDAATADGMAPKVLSAFRSFDTQSSLKSSYRFTYGSGANKFSADQGYSEHQLGTALDFTTQKTGPVLTGFEKLPEYTWLVDHAYQYGFILSYPKNNTYYIFEPWHWRFVGVALATKLHNENKYFYDLDQREINTYLINIFD